MDAKYKVGDKVKVREDLRVDSMHSGCWFILPMKNFIGKTLTIKTVGPSYYEVTENKFFWGEEMFEGLAEDTKISSAKYKVGDEVKVREDLVVNAVYDGCLFASPMQTLKGKTCTIEAFFDDNAYKLKGSGYLWTEAMFEDIAENTKVNTFTKADLKDGMIVEFKSGTKGIVLGTGIVSENSWVPLSSYRDNLETSATYFNIVKVFKSVGGAFLSQIFNDKRLELIWEKKENPGYNGKVVCIHTDESNPFITTGKIYQFVNGVMINDLGICSRKFDSFAHFDKATSDKWLEIVE